MAHVVVTTGIDAARDLDLERADFVFQLECVKAGRDFLGDGDRTGCGQRAVIHAGAGDDIADQADVGGGESWRLSARRAGPADHCGAHGAGSRSARG